MPAFHVDAHPVWRKLLEAKLTERTPLAKDVKCDDPKPYRQDCRLNCDLLNGFETQLKLRSDDTHYFTELVVVRKHDEKTMLTLNITLPEPGKLLKIDKCIQSVRFHFSVGWYK